jgi:hypothetical protein
MSQLGLLPSAEPQKPSPISIEKASVTPIGEVRCALYGSSLLGGQERYRVLSPFASMGKVTVCRTCRKAIHSEGYRPAI